MTVLRKLYQRPQSAIGVSLLILFVLMAILGPTFAPYTATEFSGSPREAPTGEHIFGTDHLGRDVFSRVLIGTRSILLMAGLGTLFAALLGSFFGLLSGYRGGLFDEILMRTFDGFLSIPALLLALLLLATLGSSDLNVFLVLTIVYTPIVARVVRSEVLSIKTKGFVEASKLQGESTGFVLFREILPSVLPALSVEIAMRFTYAIFLIASLGFLGVGVEPPSPNWGLMVSEARGNASSHPWMMFYPALAISLLVIGTNLTADGLKSILQGSSVSSQRIKRVRAFNSPEPTGKSLLSIANLDLSYWQDRTEIRALRDISLRINHGEVVGVVGESGSGKTTLASVVLNSLSPNAEISRGSVYFEDQDLLRLSPHQMRQIWGSRIGLVPQDPQASLNPSIRVGEQIAEILRLHEHLSPSQARRAARELLTSVQIADPERVMKSFPHELSGGMQQRVLIATAISTEPELLILDEPTTGLDVTTEAVILDLLRDLIRERDTAALYISHDLAIVNSIADRVVVLYAGEQIEENRASALFEEPVHPYTQGLLSSIPQLGSHKSQSPLATMSAEIPSLSSIPSGCIFAARCPFAISQCQEDHPALEPQTKSGHLVRCIRANEIVNGTLRQNHRIESSPIQADIQVSPAKPLLRIQKLQKNFPVSRSIAQVLLGNAPLEIRAIDEISFDIEHASTIGLVGESGSGKTTLARSVMGLIEPSSGDVKLNDKYLHSSLTKRSNEVFQELQLIFQNPQETLNPYRTIGDTLTRSVRQLLQVSKSEAEAKARELLSSVHLDEQYMSRLPAQISGGEKQRIGIARAFASSPSLIVCDEPTSALDVSVQARVINLLSELQRTEQTAYLFISHDLAVVGYLADSIAVIYLGQLMEISSRDGFFDPPYHPYTEALLSAIPTSAHGQSPIRLSGEIPSPTEKLSGCPFSSRCPHVLGDICSTTRPPWHKTQHGAQIFCHIEPDELARIQSPILSGTEGSE